MSTALYAIAIIASVFWGQSAMPTQSAESTDPMKLAVLSPNAFKHYIERFNNEDVEVQSQSLSIPNDESWSFLRCNIPWFDSPDQNIEEIYYYRWWTFRKHLKKTPAGWVITEFLPSVGWAGIYNTISCAAGHHLYEGRWLRDRTFVDEYARFWTLPEAEPRRYSFWFADAVQSVMLATGDRSLGQRLLPGLVGNYRAWERTHQESNGLFKQIDDRDGMEYSLGGSGYRPSINSYMYGDAVAIAAIAKSCGDVRLANEFEAKAKEVKRLVETKLWSQRDGFFETARDETCGVREEIGFVPWYFNLPSPGFETAWQQLIDPSGFSATYGPTTAERRASGFMHAENHDCLWNGPSWPYATTQTLVAMANLLDNYHQDVVSRKDYFNLIQDYAASQWKGGRPWVAEDLDADTGKWIVDLPRSVCYNHSGFADVVISGLVGLRPRQDDRVDVKPLIPEGRWPWFCLDGVCYHDQSICILWDLDGKHYGRGAGLRLYVNGRLASQRPDIGELTAKLPRAKGNKNTMKDSTWTKHSEGAVLGGSLGTCFDISVLQDQGKYKMYFSWRPKQSIALAESVDGVKWSEPRIVLGPANTGWEDDMNRPSVIKLHGLYHMWYTGQFNGRSAIGYATSKDGIAWERLKDPVLEAKQPWEKVAVMCPSVLWDESAKEFRMWYSGGEQYEPDAIGYAVSSDGVRWRKNEGPIFEADPTNWWESYKVTACQVLEHEGWHYMFYIGFRDIDHAQIGIARSKDGITNWERLKSNPIISPTVDGWDADACYKPFALYDEHAKRWLLWYNGRHGQFEQVGLATKSGSGLGF